MKMKMENSIPHGSGSSSTAEYIFDWFTVNIYKIFRARVYYVTTETEYSKVTSKIDKGGQKL